MKKAYILLFTSLIGAASFGQSIQRMVINSTGGYIGTPGAMQMLLSVGEPIIGTSETAEIGLGQGFLGGSKTVAASPEGISNITTENATIYPNPFSSVIKISSDADNIQVSVYNTLGQEVYNGVYQNSGINLSALSPGIYIVRAMSNDKIISTTKLLKQ